MVRCRGWRHFVRNGRRRVFWIWCGIYFLLMAELVWAAGDLRVLLNDAGVFDPSRGPVSVNYTLQKDVEEVAVRVRDFRGQVVSQYRFIELPAGDHVFSWDGTDQNGEPVPEGSYEFLFGTVFKDGTTDLGLVSVRVAAFEPEAGVPAPPTLPPEKHGYKISGSISSFWRHDEETHEDTGQVRARTRFTYADDSLRADGVLAYIETFPDGEANFDASQGFVEGKWDSGKIKGVFREGLGGFDDPSKLFSDYKSARKKYGFRVEQEFGALYATGLAFTTEGDVDSEETGAAARFRYGEKGQFQIGAGYTYRESLLSFDFADRYRNQALAADLRIPIIDSVAVLLEYIHTEDTEKSDDNGYTAIVEYDQGRLRASAGYIDLGEDFAADYADPLHGVTTDARGIEASLDFAAPQKVWYFRDPIITLRFFDLKRHSNDEKTREMDTSLRFGIGEQDTFLLSWYGQDNDFGTSNTFMGTVTHQWNELWASSLQVNRVDADNSGTWRFTLDTTYQWEELFTRMALEWVQRKIDVSSLSPYEETSLRLDWNWRDWSVQLHGRYSDNNEDHGTNFFGRVQYTHEFLHRYELIPYASVGNRAAFDFEEQYEVGLEVRF
jgi:hypothetical protein